MAQTTSSVGLMQKSGGTEKPHATHLPPQRCGFPLTGWRSSDTTPFEQAVAGPRCKQPRVQITDHPLPHDGGLRRAQHTHHPPQCCQRRSLAHTTFCSPGPRHSCTHGPGTKPCASSACRPYGFPACLSITMLCFPLEQLSQLCGHKAPLASPPRFCYGCPGDSWSSC